MEHEKFGTRCYVLTIFGSTAAYLISTSSRFYKFYIPKLFTLFNLHSTWYIIKNQHYLRFLHCALHASQQRVIIIIPWKIFQLRNWASRIRPKDSCEMEMFRNLHPAIKSIRNTHSCAIPQHPIVMAFKLAFLKIQYTYMQFKIAWLWPEIT